MISANIKAIIWTLESLEREVEGLQDRISQLEGDNEEILYQILLDEGDDWVEERLAKFRKERVVGYE